MTTPSVRDPFAVRDVIYRFHVQTINGSRRIHGPTLYVGRMNAGQFNEWYWAQAPGFNVLGMITTFHVAREPSPMPPRVAEAAVEEPGPAAP